MLRLRFLKIGHNCIMMILPENADFKPTEIIIFTGAYVITNKKQDCRDKKTLCKMG